MISGEGNKDCQTQFSTKQLYHASQIGQVTPVNKKQISRSARDDSCVMGARLNEARGLRWDEATGTRRDEARRLDAGLEGSVIGVATQD